MYTRPAMPQTRCPLCGKRTAGRNCPARATKICSVCCGTKREVEIDCPADCEYLAQGRAWEAGRQEPPARANTFGAQFLSRHGAAIGAVVQAVIGERATNPALLDSDVAAALAALRATLRTLDAGLYYETRPEGSLAAASLYQRLKALLDDWIRTRSPDSEDPRVLKVSEASAILEFLESTGQHRGSDRPRSRQFLDWLGEAAPSEAGPGRLIVP